MHRFTISLILLLVSLFAAHPVQAADRTVGDGTAASCTEAAFNTALAEVQTSGGGTLTFNCGGAALISFTAGKVISAPAVTIDGGGNITLSGVTAVRHFYVEANADLTLKNITLTNGFDDTHGGGSILSLGELSLEDTTIRNSSVDSGHSGGAIMAYQPVTITNSLIENNTGGSAGGLFLFGEAADATITGSTFRDNRTTNEIYGLGGALTTWNGADVIIRSSTFEGNQARKGGAIYNQDAGTTILIEQNSSLHNNSATNVSDEFEGGGGFYNFGGSVTIDHGAIRDNYAEFNGGGIYNSGDLTINNSTISHNHSRFYGGGIFSSGDVTINNSTISHNYGEDGGGLTVYEENAHLYQVTLSSNTARTFGGAIYLWDSNLILTNATISGNSADYAPGVYSFNSNASLTHVTFNGNYSTRGRVYGAAIDHWSTDPVTGITVKNVIFQGTREAGSNCFVPQDSLSPITSLGFNLSSDDSCPLDQAGDRNNVDAMLGPLADNGGPTLTHLPLAGSPAIDAGQCVTGLMIDQRGLPRLQGPACDIGAVERQPEDIDRFTIFLPNING